jgi:hypothetical protein
VISVKVEHICVDLLAVYTVPNIATDDRTNKSVLISAQKLILATFIWKPNMEAGKAIQLLMLFLCWRCVISYQFDSTQHNKDLIRWVSGWWSMRSGYPSDCTYQRQVPTVCDERYNKQ